MAVTGCALLLIALYAQAQTPGASSQLPPLPSADSPVLLLPAPAPAASAPQPWTPAFAPPAASAAAPPAASVPAPDPGNAAPQPTGTDPIPYDDGPVPPNWHVEKRPRWGMVIPGAILAVLGVVATAAYAGRSREKEQDGTTSDDSLGVLFGPGLIVVGGGLAIGGIFAGPRYLVPGAAPSAPKTRERERPSRTGSWQIAPWLGSGKVAMRLSWAF